MRMSGSSVDYHRCKTGWSGYWVQVMCCMRLTIFSCTEVPLENMSICQYWVEYILPLSLTKLLNGHLDTILLDMNHDAFFLSSGSRYDQLPDTVTAAWTGRTVMLVQVVVTVTSTVNVTVTTTCTSTTGRPAQGCSYCKYNVQILWFRDL